MPPLLSFYPWDCGRFFILFLILFSAVPIFSDRSTFLEAEAQVNKGMNKEGSSQPSEGWYPGDPRALMQPLALRLC